MNFNLEDKMKINSKLKGKDFINLEDFTFDELKELIDLASVLKEKEQSGEMLDICKGKNIIMYFTKPSLRTKLSFEVGMKKLGGGVTFITKEEAEAGKRESISDTARVMSKYMDGIVIRTFDHKDVEEFAAFADIPVINALTDKSHPCQIMADLLTIKEAFGELKGKKLTYVGDGNNVLHSLLIGCTALGMDISVACPSGYSAPADAVEIAKKNAEITGSKIEILEDPIEAVSGADVIYTDTWTSMGQEAEANQRKEIFKNYQVNKKLLSNANEGHIVMHCLPAHKGEEIDEETFELHSKTLFNQAGNRMYAQMAIMATIL